MPASNTDMRYVVADFTGEQRDDYAVPEIAVRENGGTSSGPCRLNVRMGGTDPETSPYQFGFSGTDSHYTQLMCRQADEEVYRTGDLDGDGRAELLRFVDLPDGTSRSFCRPQNDAHASQKL